MFQRVIFILLACIFGLSMVSCADSTTIVVGDEQQDTTLVNERGNSAGNILNGGRFASQGDWLYYGIRDGICKTNGTDTQVLGNNWCEFINVIGDWIYYKETVPGSDSGGTLCRIRTDGSDWQVLSDDDAQDISVVKDWIYYINWDVNGNIYRIRTDGSEKEKLTDQWAAELNVVGGFIYYICVFDYINMEVYSTEEGEDRLYYNDTDARLVIVKMDIDSGEIQKLCDDNVFHFIVDGDWIYYDNRDDNGGLYKIRTDGSDRQKLCDGDVGFINVAGDWVFYANHDDDDLSLYRIRTDGSERQKINDGGSGFIHVIGSAVVYTSGGKYWIMRTDGTDNRKIGGNMDGKLLYSYMS